MKEWLSLKEAAKHLSATHQEEVSVADILKLAINNHLILSVRFLNNVNIRDVTVDFADNEEDKVDSEYTRQTIGCKLTKPYELSQMVLKTKGTWDIIPFGNGLDVIENEIQHLTNELNVSLDRHDGIFFTNGKGRVILLQEPRHPITSDNKDDFHKTGFFPWEDPQNYITAPSLPNSCELTVRTKALSALTTRLSSIVPIKEQHFNNEITIPCINATHPFHAKELAIALNAWTELYEKNPPQHVPLGGHKKYITKWLASNHPSLSQRARDRITTIINPNPKGGASPTE